MLKHEIILNILRLLKTTHHRKLKYIFFLPQCDDNSKSRKISVFFHVFRVYSWMANQGYIKVFILMNHISNISSGK